MPRTVGREAEQNMQQRSQAWWRWAGSPVVSSARDRFLNPREITFKKEKGVNSVKCGREGRHLWTIHNLLFPLLYH